MIFKTLRGLGLAALLTLPALSSAEEYLIDTPKAHASIQFRVKHLGISWLYGRFNDFAGRFSYDEKNPAASQVEVVVKTASLDSNHAERDKHLRSTDFLDVAKYPEAKFVSTAFKDSGGGQAVLEGNLSLHGVTRPLSIAVEATGQGADPWGGYRRGFIGTTSLKLADFGINFNLGPATREVELTLSVEGIRQ